MFEVLCGAALVLFGYLAGQFVAAVKHGTACERLGLHLQYLCEYPASDAQRKELLLKLAHTLMLVPRP